MFDRVKYPDDYQPLLELAKSKPKKNDRLVEYATGSLKYFSGADIREYAIEKLKKVKIPSDYLDLLVSNYKKGDFKLLTGMIWKMQKRTRHSYHRLRLYKYLSSKQDKRM